MGDQCGYKNLPDAHEYYLERWSRNFGPVVKVDRMKREVIQNEETKEPFA